MNDKYTEIEEAILDRMLLELGLDPDDYDQFDGEDFKNMAEAVRIIYDRRSREAQTRIPQPAR